MKKSADLSRSPVQVTRSALPPLDSYMECVRDIFDSHWLTNQGKYVQRLEKDLAQWLDVPMLALCSNGTIALQLALRLLGLNGKKVITTPFTYFSTLSSLLWEGCEPILADIDPQNLCIDPAQVEKHLRAHPGVAGLMPVQVYGNACDVAALNALADVHGLRIIYDAAHAFGSRLDGKSLLAYGDASTCSFHSTKLFHTVEGGCIVTPNPADYEKLALLRAFGHHGDNHVCLGINGKMSEMHAAMGVCLLPQVREMIDKRKRLVEIYDCALEMGNNPHLRKPALHAGLEWNYGYYPVIFSTADLMRRSQDSLVKTGIHPRRYFYPSLSKLPYFRGDPCPVAEDIAERILCLPIWANMDEAIATRTSDIIMEQIGKG